jgi:hypothetical protein
MADLSTLSELREQRSALVRRLVSLSEFRPGSLVMCYRKCGKPQCHCAREGDPGHGPSWSLTRKVQGKTVTKVIGSQSLEITRRQVAEYHRFQELVHELVETNVKICDALLEAETDLENDPERAEKRGSRTRSRRKSPPS